MEHEILDLIDRYWKFDDDQTPVSNWHDKQDLLDAVRKALRIHAVVGRSEQCAHPRDKREYIGSNMLRCKVCGKEFS